MTRSDWIFAAVGVLVALGWYLSYSAARLDRLHARVEGTLAALDAQLVRRAEATLELVNSATLDAASSLMLASAASDSLAMSELAEADIESQRHPLREQPSRLRLVVEHRTRPRRRRGHHRPRPCGLRRVRLRLRLPHRRGPLRRVTAPQRTTSETEQQTSPGEPQPRPDLGRKRGALAMRGHRVNLGCFAGPESNSCVVGPLMLHPHGPARTSRAWPRGQASYLAPGRLSPVPDRAACATDSGGPCVGRPWQANGREQNRAHRSAAAGYGVWQNSHGPDGEAVTFKDGAVSREQRSARRSCGGSPCSRRRL